jgi:large exoprotein involved in heme utilization and adhesion
VSAESIELTGSSPNGEFPSGLKATVELEGTGEGGDLTVNTETLTIHDGAQVTVSSPQGQAGNLTITGNFVSLNRGTLAAETGESSAEGGANITLTGLDVLLMTNESLISANALGAANGGNITIDSKFIVATPPVGLEGSDIIANAVNGDGGRVNITSQSLFNIDFRPRRTPLNDITASSETGAAGVVSINTPNVDPSQGLAELPTNLVDAAGLVDRSCTAGKGSAFNSSFIVTGRGGLPSNPTEPLNSDAVLAGWVSLGSDAENRDHTPSDPNSTSATPQQIVEAQGWVKTPDGQVILVAEAPTVTPGQSWLTSPSCQGSQAATDR